MRKRFFRRRERGQAAVEYLMMTVALVTCFAGLYAFMQGQVKSLFQQAAIMILRAYY
jgi:Flp pilus assembly pilin Flp